jgi:hypothetical protein
MPEHNQQHQRRPHYHRGRRGPDRRGNDRRLPQTQQTEAPGRDQLDIEQIMRDVRARIAERHGIDLSSQQIQELAARRLEAILDPKSIKPSLMDELRRASGLPADSAPSEPDTEDPLEEARLYESDNSLLRVLRKLLNPILKLFLNPAAIVEAFNGQARQAREAAAREEEHRRRRTEWNALHFEILRRLVTDVARAEIENQHLAHRVESLGARVDFNERRVRGLEHTQHQSRPAGRVSEAPAAVSPGPVAPREDVPSTEHASPDATLDGSRRRRRRRRGRRSGQPRDATGMPAPGPADAAAADQTPEGDDFADDDSTPEDLGDDVLSAAPAPVEAVVEEFEPQSPRPDEPMPVASSELAPIPSAPDSAPAPSVESAERSEPLPPERP